MLSIGPTFSVNPSLVSDSEIKAMELDFYLVDTWTDVEYNYWQFNFLFSVSLTLSQLPWGQGHGLEFFHMMGRHE